MMSVRGSSFHVTHSGDEFPLARLNAISRHCLVSHFKNKFLKFVVNKPKKPLCPLAG